MSVMKISISPRRNSRKPVMSDTNTSSDSSTTLRSSDTQFVSSVWHSYAGEGGGGG